MYTPAHDAKKEPKVSKAFLITGGTQEAREAKVTDMSRSDRFLMCTDYKSGGEIAVIFSADDEALKGMNFEKAKKLAGEVQLGEEFCTSTFGNEARFGVICVNDYKSRYLFLL